MYTECTHSESIHSFSSHHLHPLYPTGQLFPCVSPPSVWNMFSERFSGVIEGQAEELVLTLLPIIMPLYAWDTEMCHTHSEVHVWAVMWFRHVSCFSVHFSEDSKELSAVTHNALFGSALKEIFWWPNVRMPHPVDELADVFSRWLFLKSDFHMSVSETHL